MPQDVEVVVQVDYQALVHSSNKFNLLFSSDAPVGSCVLPACVCSLGSKVQLQF